MEHNVYLIMEQFTKQSPKTEKENMKFIIDFNMLEKSIFLFYEYVNISLNKSIPSSVQ